MTVLELERFTFPAAGADTLSLRWVRGSGLQGREHHLGDLRPQLTITPDDGLRVVAKPGWCLVLGDVTGRRLTLQDPSGRLNPRQIDVAGLAHGGSSGTGAGSGTGTATGTGTGSGTGAGTGTGSGTGGPPAAIGAAAAINDIPLLAAQARVRFGAAGGLRGRLMLAADTWLPWALVTAAHTDDGTTTTYVAQADANGEFALPFEGLPPPADGAVLSLSLAVAATAGLSADTPPDPDAFAGWRISPDGDPGTLAATLNRAPPAYGRILNLGSLLVAPP